MTDTTDRTINHNPPVRDKNGNIKSPAPYSTAIMEWITAYCLDTYEPSTTTIIDPFAGVGNIHTLNSLGYATWGIELEHEWASQHTRNIEGDMHYLFPFVCTEIVEPDDQIVVITSPTYGNRMADSHYARDGSVRHTYRHYLGRKLDPANSGQLQWGEKYRAFHRAAWRTVYDNLRPGDDFILNVSDHIRRGERQFVAYWHLTTCIGIGFKLVKSALIETPRQRMGENGNLRINGEMIFVMKKVTNC